MMALGVDVAVRAAFPQRIVETTVVEQHRPFSIYPKWHPLRGIDRLPYWSLVGLKLFINRPVPSRLAWSTTAAWMRGTDIAIACGGPNIVPNAAASSQIPLMMHHLHGAFREHGVPMANLSVGSCYPVEQSVGEIPGPADAAFVKRMFECATVTTVRDRLAQQLCYRLGLDSPLIPCPAMLAGKIFENGSTIRGGNYIVISFQKMGANEDWGQSVNAAEWRSTVVALIDRLKKRYRIVFVCHSDSEAKLAEELDSGIPRCQPRSLAEYAELVTGALAGVCNRVHSAVALASVGAPVIAVGTDSRLGVLELMGLPHFYVKQATVDLLESTLEQLISRRAAERERLYSIRTKTLTDYVETLQRAVA